MTRCQVIADSCLQFKSNRKNGSISPSMPSNKYRYISLLLLGSPDHPLMNQAAHRDECMDWSGLSHGLFFAFRRSINPTQDPELGGKDQVVSQKKKRGLKTGCQKQQKGSSLQSRVTMRQKRGKPRRSTPWEAAAVTGWDIQGIPLGIPRNNRNTLRGSVSGN